MKKILLRTGYLGLGAIEQLAFDIVTGLKDKFEITLAIENHFNNYLIENLPKEINYFYLKDKNFENKIKEIGQKKKNNIFYKIYFNYLLIKEKSICCRKINEYIKQNGKFDLFIDYDGMAYKYAEKININKKVIWQHTALHKNKKRTEKRLDKYNKVVLLCDDMKLDYEKNFPILKDKLFRIYNFLDFSRIKVMKGDDTELTAKEKEMLNEKYCISVARLDYPKDFDTLFKAFEILKNEGIKEKLYIVGDGEQRKRLEAQIKNKELENTVYLLGRKKNPYIWIKNADIFVHSSKREGFPAVLLEALLCEKMIISSNCMTGPAEILENGKNGKLFEVGDYLKLSELLEKYIKNPELKEKYMENSKVRIRDFEKQKILKEYEEFFINVIEEKI